MSLGTAVVSLPFLGPPQIIETDDPFFVEIIAPIESETVDEAVRQALAGSRQMVDALEAQLTDGAPAEMVTFKQAYDRFVADEELIAEANVQIGLLKDRATAPEERATAVEGRVTTLEERKVETEGLATGGGDLTADRTISVPKATEEQAEAATDDTVALTPLSGLALTKAQAVAILRQWRSLLPTSADGLPPGEPFRSGDFLAWAPDAQPSS